LEGGAGGRATAAAVQKGAATAAAVRGLEAAVESRAEGCLGAAGRRGLEVVAPRAMGRLAVEGAAGTAAAGLAVVGGEEAAAGEEAVGRAAAVAAAARLVAAVSAADWAAVSV